MKQQHHGDVDVVPGWLAHELDGNYFGQARLARRPRELTCQLWNRFDQNTPMACQDWANTKAAHHFLDTGQVHEDIVLEGHYRRRTAGSAQLRARHGRVDGGKCAQRG